ncbi:ester cyclase [Plantactinospora sp. GCM10030261]|uniref:ester cyclase n=1 Tax=Plantactinospora sp. GCM10030261 TaxID=3273420 RepID=UPI00360B857A
MAHLLVMEIDCATSGPAAALDALESGPESLAGTPGLARSDVSRDGDGAVVVHLWWDSRREAERFESTGWEALSGHLATLTGRTPTLRSLSVVTSGKARQEVANEALVRRANEAFTRKDLETLLACYADDAVQYEPFIDEPIAGKQKLREYFEGSFRYFPDESITIEQLISDGPWVVGKWRCRGTHSGDFLGMPATGRQFDVPEATIYEIRDGRVQNLWVFVDSGTIAKQFGFGLDDIARG